MGREEKVNIFLLGQKIKRGCTDTNDTTVGHFLKL
jgi:hypothetical protein